MFRYRFKIIIQPEYFKDACEMMRKLDMDIGEVGIEYVIQFTSQKDIAIPILKDHLRQCIESNGLQMLHAEGGKVE